MTSHGKTPNPPNGSAKHGIIAMGCWKIPPGTFKQMTMVPEKIQTKRLYLIKRKKPQKLAFFEVPKKSCVVESSLGPAPSHFRFLQFESNPGFGLKLFGAGLANPSLKPAMAVMKINTQQIALTRVTSPGSVFFHRSSTLIPTCLSLHFPSLSFMSSQLQDAQASCCWRPISSLTNSK